MYKRKQFLKEDVALTKNSQRIMNNKASVKAIADAVRDDADFHPQAFPAGMPKKFQKATDESVAKWFLESLDNIERAGYEGVRITVPRDWVVNSYIKNKSTWEDIHGNMNMILRDWEWLGNRNLLKPAHTQITAFDGVNRMSKVIMDTYATELAEYRENAAKNAATLALRQAAKSVKLLDNDDYRIQIPFNKPASRLMADGAKWCTANSSDAMKSYWHRYADRAMIFNMIPYTKDPETGKKKLIGKKVIVTDGPRRGSEISTHEKYQFDAASSDFMDIGNLPVRPSSIIAERFPYLYDDIAVALQENAALIESNWAKWAEDQDLIADPETKPKQYDINEEIKKLEVFVQKGYFTTEKRPKVADLPPEEPPTEVDQQPKPEQGQQMESLKLLANKMLAEHGLQDELDLNEYTDINEEDMEQSDDLGSMPAADGATGGSGNLAPTMPESINKGNRIMENVDKDVAAMLTSLKKYDKLTESVLGITTVGMARTNSVSEGWDEDQAKKEKLPAPPEEVNIEEDFFHNPNLPANKQLKAPPKEVNIEEGGPAKKDVPAFLRKEKGGDWKTSKEDLEKEKDDKISDPKTLAKNNGTKVDESTGVDPEILDWMNRFSKLGNMKGYSR